MKIFSFIGLITMTACISWASIPADPWPYAPFVGQEGSTAVSMTSTQFVAWADGYIDLEYGDEVSAEWQTPGRALGPAVGTSYDIVSLGRGGQITLTFSQGIKDGEGVDFAVFENGFSDYFLELAYVEVSSDGTNFVRFPNVSYTAAGTQSVNARDVYGLAGKYRQGYGTPFDLSELVDVDTFLRSGRGRLSDDYIASFTNSFHDLDLNKVTHVRLIDVVGDGGDMSAWGAAIIDPYPTTGSAGFDLDAVGVIHQPEVEGMTQVIRFDSIPNQKLSFGALTLDARSDSGLPVAFEVKSGPAVLADRTLTFSGTGMVEVVASQAGDQTYAPAVPVVHSFMIAEEIQHIFVEPIPNLPSRAGYITLKAYSSSGLPVSMEVSAGPDEASVDPVSYTFGLDVTPGLITIRAYQPGNAITAPAEDVYFSFNVITPEIGFPVTISDWTSTNTLPKPMIRGSKDVYGRDSVLINFNRYPELYAVTRLQTSSDLESWTNAVPEMVDWNSTNMTIQLPASESNAFYRLEFEDL